MEGSSLLTACSAGLELKEAFNCTRGQRKQPKGSVFYLFICFYITNWCNCCHINQIRP